MYEEQFGFTKRPFRATPRGSEVFVGPQTAQTMQSLKKALTASDAVVTVTGPAGSGKTTQVLRALEAIDKDCTCIRLGRMQLGHDEILEFLLAKLGAQSIPASTIRRVVYFRAAVMKLRLAGHRVFIVVEDAQRLGVDALAELEALTGAENGDGDGANLVLMAPQSLKPLLRSEGLERLDQRVRVRHRVAALNEAELGAYLKHCFRLAGAEFDLIFNEGAVKQLFGFSAGIPRVANNLVESVLTAAAERQMDKIDPSLIAEIAGAEYEMTVDTRVPDFEPVEEASAAPDDDPTDDVDSATDAAAEVVSSELDLPDWDEGHFADADADESESIDTDSIDETPVPVAEEPALDTTPTDETPVGSATADEADAPQPLAAVDSEPVEATTIVNDTDAAASDSDSAPDDGVTAVESVPDVPENAPVVAASQVSADTDVEPLVGNDAGEPEADIPELIQDTLPDLEVLAPEVMERSAISDAEVDAEDIPTLFSSIKMKAPLAEPATLGDDDGGKVFIGEDAEPTDVAVPQQASPNAVSDDPQEPEPASAAGAPNIDLPFTPSQAPVKTAAAETVEPPAVPKQPVAPAPAVAAVATPQAAQAAAPPDLPAAAQVGLPASNGETPAWDRDPTLAELKPDLEALELAMAEFSDEEPAKKEPDETEPAPEVELKDPTLPALPAITLDVAIDEKIREAEEALDKHDATIAEEDAPADDVSERDTRADAELEKIAQGLSRAKTIEDVDDRMAETLFGEEISLIAAQVTMNKPANEALAEPEPTEEPALSMSPEPETSDVLPEPTAATEEPESEFEREFREVYGEGVEVSLETKPKPGMDLSASQRLATVRALNAGIVQPPKPAPAASAPSAAPQAPASIEDQIDTSLSQTIKTLNIEGPASVNDDDDEEETKGGFFSRFRRS